MDDDTDGGPQAAGMIVLAAAFGAAIWGLAIYRLATRRRRASAARRR